MEAVIRKRLEEAKLAHWRTGGQDSSLEEMETELVEAEERDAEPAWMAEEHPPWSCPWQLPVGPEGHETVRAICVWPEPHPDDAEHLAIVDSTPYLFGTDVGERRR